VSKGPGGKTRISWVSNAALLRCLVDGPHTVPELCEETGLSEGVCRGYVRLMNQRKLVYVCAWLPSRQGAPVIRQWRWGPDKPDAPRPRRQTQKQRAARYRERTRRAKLQATMQGTADWRTLRGLMSNTPLSPLVKQLTKTAA
jgi:hypothetical protein